MLTAYSLFIRLPSRQMAQELTDLRLQPLSFAIADKTENIVQSGVASLASLAEQLSKAKKVHLLIAASDVTLLNIAVPPLSSEKLQLALPTLVEDSIISDPATCHIVAGAEVGGLRRLAVIDRTWINTLINTVQKEGAKACYAYPAQLCLPLHENSVTASVMEMADKADLSLRWPNNETCGLALSKEKNGNSIEDAVCRTLLLLAPKDPIRLFVEDDRAQAYSAVVSQLTNAIDNNNHLEHSKIQIFSENWKSCLSEIKKIDIDLMVGISNSLRERASYLIWKLPIVLATTLLILNLIALHFDWWRMYQEKNQLYANLENSYKKHFMQSANPEEQLAKLEEKLLILRQKKGMRTPEDFISMLANTSAAWKKLNNDYKNTSSNSTIVSSYHSILKLEYRNAQIQLNIHSSLAPEAEQAKLVFKENHLQLQQLGNRAETKSDMVVWNLRARP